MPKKPLNIKKPFSSEVSALVFDTAVPLALQQTAKERKPTTLAIKTGDAPLSPYIIHLGKNDDALTRKRASMDALAKRLLEDGTDLLDVHESEDEEALLVDFSDIADQFADDERGLATRPTPSAREGAPSLAINLATEAPILHTSIDPFLPETTPEQVVTHKIKKPVRLLTVRFSVPPRIRAVAGFLLLSFVVSLPLHAMQSVRGLESRKDEIMTSSESALEHMLNASGSLESEAFLNASSEFSSAREDFANAQAELADMNLAITTALSLIPQTDKAVTSVEQLLVAGEAFARSGELLSESAETIGADSVDLTTKITVLGDTLAETEPLMADAVKALDRVSVEAFPLEHQEKVAELKEMAPRLLKSMRETREMTTMLATILGSERKMRYLLVFQNNTELRPTGGFMGSFAEIDIYKGKIESVRIPEGGTYDLEGQLTEFVASPKPLSLLSERFEFQDANYSPDFPTSAKKILWFYEKSGGPTVDGVIAINATMMPKLLEILGPVEMPEYGRTIDAENFLFETQKIVEIDHESLPKNDPTREEEAPKQFIGDLAPILLARIQTADMEQMLKIADLLGTSLFEREAQLFFENNSLQSEVERLAWSGSQKKTTGDYLMVVNTNLGGGKTDMVIDQDVHVAVKIEDDGRIVNTVTIEKKHRGLASDLFANVNNVDYLRLYVPKGATLLSADGFEIPPDDLFKESTIPLKEDEDFQLSVTNARRDPLSKTDIWDENGYTVFGNWMQTARGETETVTFTYELPFRFEELAKESTLLDVAKAKIGLKDLETYTLFIQKQSGVRNRETTVDLSLPKRGVMTWSTHDPLTTVTNETDQFLRYLVEIDPT